MDLTADISKLSGVGEKVASKLNKLGIKTVGDLLTHYPRRYNDFSKLVPIARLKPGQVSVKGEITHIETRRTGRGRSLTEALVEDDSGSVKAVWFNQPYLKSSLPVDKPVFVSGELAFKYGNYAFQNPDVETADSENKNTARIVPVYPETEGISSKYLRKLLHGLLPISVEEPLPASILKKYALTDRSAAFKQVHFPDSIAELEAARRRLAFEEIYILMLAARKLKAQNQGESAPRVPFDVQLTKDLVKSLPFDLTDDQRKSAWRILRDMEREVPMNRLLQGDVGSGKTVVAAIALQQAAAAGFQTALLAPTEVLARQHLKTLQALPGISDMEVDLLVSGLKKSQKTELQNRIKQGKAKVLIGTHALLEEKIRWHKLGLAIVDEQHRFGVEQRNRLRQQKGYAPHLLTMSATPIPRSLALTVYGDLDISSLKTRPPGRKPVQTQVISSRSHVQDKLEKIISDGGQVYVVCPLIEESDKLGVNSVEKEIRRLKTRFGKYRIQGLHGRLPTKEKDEIMRGFHKGDIDILVATTVVEVGLDVRNANAIVIEGAERFGLATLHQLRGRVGRGQAQAFCFLVPTEGANAGARLRLLERYDDGFTLAEKDLQLRGGGEIYGLRQHGALDFKIARISDSKLIALVQAAVEETDIARYPVLEKAVKGRLTDFAPH